MTVFFCKIVIIIFNYNTFLLFLDTYMNKKYEKLIMALWYFYRILFILRIAYVIYVMITLNLLYIFFLRLFRTILYKISHTNINNKISSKYTNKFTCICSKKGYLI